MFRKECFISLGWAYMADPESGAEDGPRISVRENIDIAINPIVNSNFEDCFVGKNVFRTAPAPIDITRMAEARAHDALLKKWKTSELEQDVGDAIRRVIACHAGVGEKVPWAEIAKPFAAKRRNGGKILFEAVQQRLKYLLNATLVEIERDDTAEKENTRRTRKQASKKSSNTSSVDQSKKVYLLMFDQQHPEINASNIHVNTRNGDSMHLKSRLGLLLSIVALIHANKGQIQHQVLQDTIEGDWNQKHYNKQLGTRAMDLIPRFIEQHYLKKLPADGAGLHVYALGPRALIEFNTEILYRFRCACAHVLPDVSDIERFRHSRKRVRDEQETRQTSIAHVLELQRASVTMRHPAKSSQVDH